MTQTTAASSRRSWVVAGGGVGLALIAAYFLSDKTSL